MNHRAAWLIAGLFASMATTGSAHAEPIRLSLREVLRRATTDPPTVVNALSTLERTTAEEEYARGAYLPVFSAQASAGLLHDNRIVIPSAPRLSSDSTNALGTASLDWVALSASRGGTVRSAEALTRSQKYNVQSAARVATGSAAEIFIRARASIALVEDGELTLERRTEQLKAVRGLVAAGLRPDVDAQRTEIDVVEAGHMLETLRAERAAAFAALASAVGRDPALPVAPAGDDLGVFAVSLSPKQAERVALAHRPELGQAGATLESRRADYDAAVGARLPTIGFNATGTASYLGVFSGLGIDGYAHNETATIYAKWNGLDPAVWGKGSVAAAAVTEAKERRTGTQFIVKTEAVNAALEVVRARSILDEAVAVLKAAEVTRTAQTGRYRTGLASLLELLDAESVEQTARQRRIQAERDYEIAGARLLSSCGTIEQLAR